MTNRSKSILVEVSICLGIVLFVAGWVFVPMWWFQWKAADLMGATPSAVEAALGTPFKIVTPADIEVLPAGHAWWGQSWSPRPEYPVRNKALLYYKGAVGVVIFVSPEGFVEHVAKIGT